MALENLAPELIHQIYNTLSTISDVINLSLTCHRLNALLRHAHKLSTLFAAAEREFGPIQDIKMLVTYNNTLPVHAKREPVMSYSLLRQMIVIGGVGKKFEELYPKFRWHHDFTNRRALTSIEGRHVRQAVYRYWLYSEAFHNNTYSRTHRLLPSVIEERSQLLRCWSTNDLIDIEDVRSIMEDILTHHICPTDGAVQQRVGRDFHLAKRNNWSQLHSRHSNQSKHLQHLFHGVHENCDDAYAETSTADTRFTKMDGWGDEVSQYYIVQSMLKLSPAQVMWLYEHAAYKWQVESLISDLGEEWFWNNGQTFLDTWVRIMHARGHDPQDIRASILDLHLGIAINGPFDDRYCESDVMP